MRTESTKIEIKELRNFGLILFLVLSCGFGLTFPLLAGKAMRPLPIVVGSLFAIVGIFAPSILSPVFDIWMKIGSVLGWINSRIILAVVYYVIVVPYSLLLRFSGKDSMCREWQKEISTYRKQVLEKNNTTRMEKPY